MQSLDELKTLWIGDVESWMDDHYLRSLFAHLPGEVAQVKVIRDKATGLPSGYGFIEFVNHPIAQRVLETHNGRPLPTGTGKVYRLNWASYGINERRPEQTGPEFSIFVGDLSPEVNDYMLQQTFASQYCSVKSAKVVTDPTTGQPRGYGFVRFTNEQEMIRAMNEMQGQYCGSRPMRINSATPKKTVVAQDVAQMYGFGGMPTIPNTMNNNIAAANAAAAAAAAGTSPSEPTDPNNTTIFIGGLDNNLPEDELRRTFEAFGPLVYVKIPHGKGCGFVQFTNRANAEAAFSLHGQFIGTQRVRLSWGRGSNIQNGGAPKLNSASQSHAMYPGYSAYGGAYGQNYYPYSGYNMSNPYDANTMAAYAAAASASASTNAPANLYASAQQHSNSTSAAPNSKVKATATPHYLQHQPQPQQQTSAWSSPSSRRNNSLFMDFMSPSVPENDNSTFVRAKESEGNMWGGLVDETDILLSLASSLHTLDDTDHDDESSDASSLNAGEGLGRFIPMFAN